MVRVRVSRVRDRVRVMVRRYSGGVRYSGTSL